MKSLRTMEIRRSEKLTSAFGSGELKSSEILNTCIRDGIHYTYAVIAKLSSRLLIFFKNKISEIFFRIWRKGCRDTNSSRTHDKFFC